MKARSRWFWAGGCGLAAAGASLLALQCAPNDDTTVSVVKDCKLDALNLSDPAEATVKVYVQTGTELRDRAKSLVSRFKDVCNAINKDLGAPLGDDVHLACNPIAERIQKANARAPVPPVGIAPVWASITFDDRPCAPDAKATAACLDTCSGQAAGCNPAATCTASEGKCAANCTGACAVTGNDVGCRGACFGECKSPDPDGGPEGGVPACAGECRGTCKAPSWTGRCSVGCKTGFIGVCSGVCTGTCDAIGFPYDAGAEGGPEEGGVDAGPVVDAGSGACNGICRGSCTGQASGSCTARCAGEFAGGACAGAGNCVGTCDGVGVPCVTTCSGSCETATAQCQGTCSACSGPFAESTCTGTFDCQANPICKAACGVKGALEAKCTPVAFDVRVAGDYALDVPLKAHMAEFSQLTQELATIVQTQGGVTDRTVGDFHSVGVVLDNARLCAIGGQPLYEEARTLLNEAVGASLIVRGTKF